MRTARLIVPSGVVRLRSPEKADGRRWRELRLADEKILRAVEPTLLCSWEEAHRPKQYRKFLRSWKRAEMEGTAAPAVIELDGQMVGMVTIGSIQPFPVSQAWIGYWVGSSYTHGGVATAAVALACDYARRVGIHRLEATVLSDNGASIRVLEKCGFEHEGIAREAFHMDGAWRDHEVYGRVTAASAVGMIVSAGSASYQEAQKSPL